jgi:dihydroneopterin aldolase
MRHQRKNFRQVNLPEYTVVKIRLSNGSASLALPFTFTSERVRGEAMSSEDKIILHNMAFRGRHGVHPAERELGQRFEIDVELGLDLSRAMASDALTDTVDYSRLHAIVREEVEEQQYQLIETLAGTLVRRLLAELPITSVLVRVRKPQVPLNGMLGFAAVEIQRRR